MIRPLIVIALLASSAAAGAADVPAGKIQTLRGDVPAARCRGALVVPAGKINAYGHAATQPRCDLALLAANERQAPLGTEKHRRD